MAFNNNNINASARMITTPSLNETLSWADNSVPIGYSSNNISGKLYSSGINVSDSLNNIQAVLAQQVFQKAVEKNPNIIAGLSEDDISTLTRNFACAYWSQPNANFSKSYVLIDVKNLKCGIYKDINEAKQEALNGYTESFEIIY